MKANLETLYSELINSNINVDLEFDKSDADDIHIFGYTAWNWFAIRLEEEGYYIDVETSRFSESVKSIEQVLYHLESILEQE